MTGLAGHRRFSRVRHGRTTARAQCSQAVSPTEAAAPGTGHVPTQFLPVGRLLGHAGCYRVTPIGPQTGGRFGQMQGFQVRHQATPWPVRWPGCGAQGSGRRSDPVVHPRWQPDRRMAVRDAAGGWNPCESHFRAFTDAKFPNAEALRNWVTRLQLNNSEDSTVRNDDRRWDEALVCLLRVRRWGGLTPTSPAHVAQQRRVILNTRRFPDSRPGLLQ